MLRDDKFLASWLKSIEIHRVKRLTGFSCGIVGSGPRLFSRVNLSRPNQLSRSMPKNIASSCGFACWVNLASFPRFLSNEEEPSPNEKRL